MDSCKWGENVIIFGVNNGYSVNTDARSKNILVLGEGRTQGLDNAAITAEAKYPINQESGSVKRLCLSLHYNESNSFLFVNAAKMYQFKVKDSEIKPYLLCLDISQNFTINNMKKITYMWRRWGTSQKFFLAFIDKLEKQIIKKTAEVGQ